MTQKKRLLPLLIGTLGVPLFCGVASAQKNPTFSYDKAPDESPEEPEWAAQVKGGLLISGGNAQATNGSFSATASRKAGNNKFSVDAQVAYGRADIRTFTPDLAPTAGGGPDTGVIDSPNEETREDVEATNNASLNARYDRFFTENDSSYAKGSVARDRVAGKKVIGGGQVGYSRRLYQDDMHNLVSEVGYDFSYESYFTAGDDAVEIHSLRLFVGETLKLSEVTGIYANVEALFNVNEEADALDASQGNAKVVGVDAFKDTRINGKAGITTKVWDNISFGFGFTVRYDQNPAPLNASFADDFRLFANEFDYIVDASLIVTLL